MKNESTYMSQSEHTWLQKQAFNSNLYCTLGEIPTVLLHASNQNYEKCDLDVESKSEKKEIPHFPQAINSSRNVAQIKF